MQTTAIIVWIYGVLVLVGGMMGWTKARSVPSLLSGVGFGTALVGCGFMVWREMDQALPVAASLTGALLVVMAIRLIKTKKFMPAGLTVALSLIALARVLMTHAWR